MIFRVVDVRGGSQIVWWMLVGYARGLTPEVRSHNARPAPESSIHKFSVFGFCQPRAG